MSRRAFVVCAVALGSCLITPVSAWAQQSCTVTFFLDDAVVAGALSFDVGYDPARTDFVGSSDQVSCTGLVPNSLPSFFDDEAAMTLTAATLGFPLPFSGPRAMAICDIDASVTPMPADFNIVVTDASDGLGVPLSPLPTVSVSGINCSGTTTTTTTSTTLGSTTTTLFGSSTTTTTLGGTLCDVTFGLFNFVTLGALQFDTDYSAVPGEFVGVGTGVDCTRLVNGVLGSFSDQDALGMLTVGYIATSGFQGPTDLAVCSFLADSPGLIPADFPVTVTDASDPGSNPVSAFVMVSSVECGTGTTTTTTTSTSTTTTTMPVCGDGFLQVGEECDDGVANSDTIADACRTDCRLANCGDGTVDSAEECDAGPANSSADPTAACTDGCAMTAECGDADASGVISAGDALRVLQNAVGNNVVCPMHRCDSDGSGIVTASDSQRVLQRAVGQPVLLDCTLGLRILVNDAVSLGSVQVRVDYAATGGTFVGLGSQADCRNLLAPAVGASFDNNVSLAALSATASALAGFNGPVGLAECRFFNSGTAPDPTSFVVQAISATDVAGNPTLPPAVSLQY